jgi:serine acetyltransferase
MAYVEPGARVGEDTWIGPGSWIDRGAVIGKRVFIGTNVHIGENALLGNGCRIGSHSKLGSSVRVAPLARLERDTTLGDGKTVAASAKAWASGAPASRPPGTGERRLRGSSRAA